MNLETLRQEAATLLAAVEDEALLEDVVQMLREPAAQAVADAAHASSDETLVSFDADGRGYTAQQLGDTLDERVRAMRRGEGVLTLEEFKRTRKAWRDSIQ